MCVFLANATEEFFVRKSPLYEVVGQLGMWGMIINGIQAAGLEHNDMRTATWDGFNSEFLSCFSLFSTLFHLSFPSLFRPFLKPLFFTPFARSNSSFLFIYFWFNFLVGLIVAYTAAMFILYTVAPLLYRLASSAYYNLSLLSSDFYGLLFGLFLFVSGLLFSFWWVADNLRFFLPPPLPPFFLAL